MVSLRERGVAAGSSRRVENHRASRSLDEEEEDGTEGEDSDDGGSASDEYVPEAKHAGSSRTAGKKRKTVESESDLSAEDDRLFEENGSNRKRSARPAKRQEAAQRTSMPSGMDDDDDDDDDDDEALLGALEAAEDAAKAKQAWESVKARKAGMSSQPSTGLGLSGNSTSRPSQSLIGNSGQQTLDNFLGVKDDIGPPVTCESAWIYDRESLFVGWVYPLLTSSVQRLTQIMTYHSRRIHPTVPVSRLPPQFASVPASKRGASHDMHAWAVLELKRGRSGLEGPSDFALQTGKDDDGEKGGGDRIERVIKECGASDVLVFVSRWYGGTLLGPDRFKHIMTVAKAALEEHMRIETVQLLIAELQELDERIEVLRASSEGSVVSPVLKTPAYDVSSLTEAKVGNLLRARRATIKFLEEKLRKAQSTEARPSRSQATPTASPGGPTSILS